ncbi:MAG: hypothetical protein CL943_01855 [Candidatus Diapherotrites archaeon]|uniref:YkgJ family cysteine cluster protein n=1 Tax=Candidatus Iainarchaeum sp. TaxID=3101447 RepID=A0A2D6M0T9_9ARCH|nr:hypothetical protein [Candidatus Diapherotrites archaeon]|tara:strand:+ start:23227 stop:23859 length:633 start_codon:yes stop_codon:yes gene_type:complete
MKLDCIGLSCSECCQRYWITLLPKEARRMAKALGISEKEFIQKKCVLIVHFYSTKTRKGLTVNTELLPSSVAKFVEKEFVMPPYFLVLPSLALKRDRNGHCTLLKKGKCVVHEVAPIVCSLFPFVALSKRTLPEIYPFCVALQQKEFEKINGTVDQKQKERVNKYFAQIEKNGFSSQWTYLPSKGLVLLEGKLEFQISRKEFLQLIAPFS